MHHQIHFGDSFAANEELGEAFMVAGEARVEVGTAFVLQRVQDGLADCLERHHLLHLSTLKIYNSIIIIARICRNMMKFLLFSFGSHFKGICNFELFRLFEVDIMPPSKLKTICFFNQV